MGYGWPQGCCLPLRRQGGAERVARESGTSVREGTTPSEVEGRQRRRGAKRPMRRETRSGSSGRRPVHGSDTRPRENIRVRDSAVLQERRERCWQQPVCIREARPSPEKWTFSYPPCAARVKGHPLAEQPSALSLSHATLSLLPRSAPRPCVV